MLKKFLIVFVVFSESIYQALGKRRTLQPYGPKMCGMLCEGSKGCSGHMFDEIQLICQFLDSETTSIYTCPSVEEDRGMEGSFKTQLMGKRKIMPIIKQDKKLTNKKKSGQVCTDLQFIYICRHGELDDVKRVACQGQEDIDCKNNEDVSCVMQAAISHNQQLFDFLVHNGCDLSAVDEENSTVLHYACLGGSMYIVKKLVDDHKLDIHLKDENGNTPLFYAEHIPIVKFLKDKGADFKAVDKKNNTILHIASSKGSVDVVKFVLSLNIIDLECKGQYGRTPLMLAVEKHKRNVVDILYTQHGASLTTTDEFGSNILHIAVISQNLEMVKYLVTKKELRGFMRKKDLFGTTPVKIAMNIGLYDIAILLKSMKFQSIEEHIT